jgi:hypothetical protein
MMKKMLIAAVAVLSIASTAHAKTYTYVCRVDYKLYPVTLTTPYEREDGSGLGGGTITWRGVTFRDVKWEDDCHAKFTATRDGVTVELCTATQGVADLTVDGDTFECQMPGRGWPMPKIRAHQP